MEKRPSKSHCLVEARQYRGDESDTIKKDIASEVPVSLVYKGTSHVVMMASPDDLEDFGLGFSLSERIIQHAEELEHLDVIEDEKGIVIAMDIPNERHRDIAERRRYLSGRTGCGLCGVESLEEALPDLTSVHADALIERGNIYKAFDALHDYQPVKKVTGAVHGAAWCDIQGRVMMMREDVGRHNALDKLIGAMARADIDFTDGFCLITSRCSYEMVQKTVNMNIPVLAAISAPTGLAVQMADDSNLTLLALTREKTFTAFTHLRRIKG